MNKKLLYVLPLLAIIVVSAGLIEHYGLFSQEIEVNQPVYTEGDLSQSIPCDSGEICNGESITIGNEGNSNRNVQVLSSDEEGITTYYIGELDLTKKDTTTWEATGEPITIEYTIVGGSFEFSGVPEGHSLIYYKDGIVGLEGRLENPQPAIEVTSDIGNLPQEDDANLDADYSETPDFYEHKIGAKLWVVPNSAILEGNVLDWSQMANFYYETDLVQYNTEGNLFILGNTDLEIIPKYELDIALEEGTYTIETQVNPIA